MLPPNTPPAVVLDILFEAINGPPGSKYYGMVERQTRCVTVYYADGMHLDITPTLLVDEHDPRRSVLFHAKPEEPPQAHRQLLMNSFAFCEWFNERTPVDLAFVEAYRIKANALDEARADADVVPVPSHSTKVGGKSAAVVALAGTSTGGIIALALSRGLTASEIRDVYVERGGNIFPPSSRLRRVWRSLRRLQRYPYEREPLQNELLRIFGDAAFGEARTRLCIPSFEGRYGEPWIYKTPHHPDYKRDRHASMVTVGLATAAAPTFFAALPNNGYVMVDGGLRANNPVMSATVDALACFEIKRRQIRVLSLGCGETSFKVDAKKAKGGLFHWWNVYWAAMRAQSHNALGQAYLLVGKDQVIRLDAPESDTPIDLDDYIRAKVELPLMARSLVEAGGETISKEFFAFPVDKFTPCPLSIT